jgi:hypothetical protein
MQQLHGRVPELLDRHGLSEEILIDKYLRPLLEAEETIFFQKDGKVKQLMNVAAPSIHGTPRYELLSSYMDLMPRVIPRRPRSSV